LEYHALKVNFDSFADWQQKTDILRCNPDFRGNPRFDFAIVQTTNGFIFAKLVFLFEYTIEDTPYSFALIHPYDAAIGPRRQKDIDLGFYRVRAKPRQSSEFISVRSIVRGALLVEDFGRDGDHLVIDLVDSDIFLRLKAMYSR
jgi:hypothetical protein